MVMFVLVAFYGHIDRGECRYAWLLWMAAGVAVSSAILLVVLVAAGVVVGVAVGMIAISYRRDCAGGGSTSGGGGGGCGVGGAAADAAAVACGCGLCSWNCCLRLLSIVEVELLPRCCVKKLRTQCSVLSIDCRRVKSTRCVVLSCVQ